MAITGNLVVPEKGTIFFDISFHDEDGADSTPTTITWTLTDSRGVVINSRTAVSVTPASAITIALSGVDNAIASTWADDGNHFLTIETIYTSTHGSGMTDKLQIPFKVKQLLAVS
jgi:hypothetical protein